MVSKTIHLFSTKIKNILTRVQTKSIVIIRFYRNLSKLRWVSAHTEPEDMYVHYQRSNRSNCIMVRFVQRKLLFLIEKTTRTKVAPFQG